MNPKIFKIINGKLYLSWSEDDNPFFTEKASEYIEKAEANWNNANPKK